MDEKGVIHKVTLILDFQSFKIYKDSVVVTYLESILSVIIHHSISTIDLLLVHDTSRCLLPLLY